jgi:hypothetical protein
MKKAKTTTPYTAKYKRKRGPRTYHGKKVADAGSPLSLNITEADRRRGKANDPHKCAGAMCIRRTYPEKVVDVAVHRHITMIELVDKVIRYVTGTALRDQTIRYDAARKFEPGTYVLNRVPPSQIKARGQQHSAPDRSRGDPNSPKARGQPMRLRHVGREGFHFNTENSDFKKPKP